MATARRDLEALSAAGVPVYPQAGRGGGWSLVGGARTDLTGLTSSEARAVFLLAGPVRSAPLASALRKLVHALPETFRADAQAAADAVVIDPARWGERDRARPPLVDALQDAVVGRRRVEIDYGGRGRRVVDPWGPVDKDDTMHWRVVYTDEARQEPPVPVRLRELRLRAGRSAGRGLYRRVGDVFVIGGIGPEAQSDKRGFGRAVAGTEARLDQIEED